jgi:hypothetical protein
MEHADAIFLFGHNMPEIQTVLGARVPDSSQCFHAGLLLAQAVPQTTLGVAAWPGRPA